MAYRINVLIDDYTDMALRDKLVLNGVHEGAYQKKLTVRTFFSIDVLIKTLEKESYKIVIVIAQSKIHSEKLLWILNERKIRPIFINHQFSNTNYFFGSVIPNYYSAVYQLSRMIFREHPQPSAFVGYNIDSMADKFRMDGFKKAVDEYRLDYEIFPNDGDVDMAIDNVLKKVIDFKNLICANDVVALLLIGKMKDAGLCLENFNITGYGNIESGKYFKPSLTTIIGDYYNEGIMAVDIYIFLLKKGCVHNLCLNTDSQIILRGSTHLKIKKFDNEMKSEVSGGMINFYGNESVKKIDTLERMLINCDETDINILKGLFKGWTYEKLCEINLMAVNTIKYRVKKMENNLGVRNKNELLDCIKSYDLALQD